MDATELIGAHIVHDFASRKIDLCISSSTSCAASRDRNEILVLDQGEIVERGRHEALLASEGVYAAMWNRQREVDEAEATLRRAEAAEGRSMRTPVAE